MYNYTMHEYGMKKKWLLYKLSYMYLLSFSKLLSVSSELNLNWESSDSDWLSAAPVWYG